MWNRAGLGKKKSYDGDIASGTKVFRLNVVTTNVSSASLWPKWAFFGQVNTA